MWYSIFGFCILTVELSQSVMSSSPTSGMETCSWESDSWSTSCLTGTESSLGSECEWSSDQECEGDSVQSTPARKWPKITTDSPALGCSPQSCDWSDHDGLTPTVTALRLPVGSAADNVRRSPRKRTRKKLFDPSGNRPAAPSSLASSASVVPLSIAVVDTWNLFVVMEMRGCEGKCVRTVHGLSEYDILNAHSNFSSKSSVQQRQWIFDYFSTHCPSDDHGRKDPKNMTLLLCGKSVCCPVWLATLSISSSRFYEVRREFVDGKTEPTPKRPRSMSVKSFQAIAWMSSYFERVGDKRPDKDGIYLPTCLTEKAIHSHMVEELFMGDESQAICLSQFNKIYRTSFPNVTIPKVIEL